MLRTAPLLVLLLALACTQTEVIHEPLEHIPRVTVVPVDPNVTPIRRIATPTEQQLRHKAKVDQLIATATAQAVRREWLENQERSLAELIEKHRKMAENATPMPTRKPVRRPTPKSMYESQSSYKPTAVPRKTTPGPYDITEVPTRSSREQEAALEWGCVHFLNAYSDLLNKEITLPQFKRKMEEVENDFSGTRGEAMARRVVDSITVDDPAAFMHHMQALYAMCY